VINLSVCNSPSVCAAKRMAYRKVRASRGSSVTSRDLESEELQMASLDLEWEMEKELDEPVVLDRFQLKCVEHQPMDNSSGAGSMDPDLEPIQPSVSPHGRFERLQEDTSYSSHFSRSVPKGQKRSRTCIAKYLLAGAGVFFLGLLIGLYAHSTEKQPTRTSSSTDLLERAIQDITAEKIQALQSASACLYAAVSACGNKNIYKDNCIIYSAGAAEMVQSIVGISHIEARWRDLEENEGNTGKLTPERYQITPERYQITPERYQITPERYQITPERYQITPERYQITPEYHLVIHNNVINGRCPQDTLHRTFSTGRCPQDAAHRTLPIGHCQQDAAHRTLPTGHCPQDAAHRTLPTGRCPQAAAHRTLPTGHCPQDAAHRTLPTDESRFYLSTCDRRDRLWRRRGECYATCNIIQHDWFGGIRMQSLDPLSAGAVGPGFLLVHNNARPHVARVCRQFLENEGIDTIDWPTGLPDLNPIEHLWDIMFRSIRRQQVALQTVQELSDALVQIWEKIPQDTIRLPLHGCPEDLDVHASSGGSQALLGRLPVLTDCVYILYVLLEEAASLACHILHCWTTEPSWNASGLYATNMILKVPYAEECLFAFELNRDFNALASAGEEERTKYLAQQWEKLGLRNVQRSSYNVLVSRPGSLPNMVVDVTAKRCYLPSGASCEAPSSSNTSASSEQLFAFAAYSATGTLEAEVVDVQYGSSEDLRRVRAKMNVTGKIALLKLGQAPLLYTLSLLAEVGFGASLLYVDPCDIPTEQNAWQKAFGVTLNPGGDPSTPDYPSTAGSFREERHNLTSLLVQPISAHLAKELLSAPVMDYGRPCVPLVMPPSASGQKTVKLTVGSQTSYAKVHNVIGYLKGKINPASCVYSPYPDRTICSCFWVSGPRPHIPCNRYLVLVGTSSQQLVRGRHQRDWELFRPLRRD
ncbi:hypothetical protein NFI96_020380, partial [Prochilodus magdalenae]